MAKVAPLPPQFEFDPKNKLAEGSGGAVYVCNDPRYAVKQILLSKLDTAEVAVMAFVQRGSLHTRCVGLVDYYCDSKHAFLVMEKAADCLIDYVAKRHGSRRWFTCQEVRSAAVAMLESIEALHDNNILHRDIKPVLPSRPVAWVALHCLDRLSCSRTSINAGTGTEWHGMAWHGMARDCAHLSRSVRRTTSSCSTRTTCAHSRWPTSAWRVSCHPTPL